MYKTGAAFPDYISKGEKRKIRNFDFRGNSTRDFLLLTVFGILFTILLFKLFSLQILEGSYYRSLSDSNRIKTIITHAPRGGIFDRNGKPLVFNIPGFRRTVNGKTSVVSKEDALKILSENPENSGLEYDSIRDYPYKDIFAHVLGFTGQISQDELKEPKFAGRKADDLVGKTGIEQYYEDILRGQDGKQLIEVDSRGRIIRKLGETDPLPGRDITLNLDLDLQKAAFSAMKDVKRGAVVVSTPKGEILALLSKPSFDPNLFTKPNPSERALQNILFDDKNQTLLDRAISGAYPPGSTFKLVVASAGLEDKVIDENWQVEDKGIINVGSFSFSNWYFSQYGKTEGLVNVVKGIKRSNDIFFYKLAEEIGVDKISEFAKKFGLGKPLGIDLEGEAGGLVPTQEWKKSQIGESWYLGDTYHYGIGQGYLLTTPLQVNGWTQSLANGGTLYQPQLIKSQKSKIKSQKFLSGKTVQLIKEGMVQSCSTGGVAWPLFDFKVKGKPVQIACKTGTAQHGSENTLPHAWITLFAPAVNPQIVVTVLAEESGEGSNVAAPIAKKILEEWFGR